MIGIVFLFLISLILTSNNCCKQGNNIDIFQYAYLIVDYSLNDGNNTSYSPKLSI